MIITIAVIHDMMYRGSGVYIVVFFFIIYISGKIPSSTNIAQILKIVVNVIIVMNAMTCNFSNIIRLAEFVAAD